MAEGEKKKTTPSAEIKKKASKKESAPQIIGYDPQTGVPIFDQENGPKPSRFDPQTGKPIYEEQKNVGPLSEEEMKKREELLAAAMSPEGAAKAFAEMAGIQVELIDGENPEGQKKDEVRIVKTDVDSIDGQVKCPKCGATDISTNVNNGKLRCNYCRHEFEPIKVNGFVEDISQLQGQVIASGATDIIADTKDVITMKCQSCGAEVVVDTSESTQARCHWCRNTLSINNQIPNGAIPDVVLPFIVKKDDARFEIEKFVGKRKFFANPQFKKEFTTENIMGVYFPYMLVDVNAHASLSGEGEHETRSYWVGDGEHRQKRYDADLYHVERDFDITINGLSVESNSDRINNTSSEKTNNIINAIMPFDIENCVKYDSNYIKGFTSEKRDINIEQIKPIVDAQSKDIARFAANDTLKHYDRGVSWKQEDLSIKGEQWKSAYLPVWLYSYQEKKGNSSLLHYVAVNARTKETMGSVPIHMPKLVIVSIIIEILAILLMINIESDIRYFFLLSGIVYFFIIYSKYRNKGARHKYELETTRNMTNVKQVDNFIRSEHGLSNSMMTGANNKRVFGLTTGTDFMSSFANAQVSGPLKDIVNKTIPNDNDQNNTIIK